MPCGSNSCKNNTMRLNTDLEEDGMEDLSNMDVLKLRFSTDQRVLEARRMLQSAQPVRITIQQRADVSDHEFIQEQEKHLYAICTRTMALPVGRCVCVCVLCICYARNLSKILLNCLVQRNDDIKDGDSSHHGKITNSHVVPDRASAPYR